MQENTLISISRKFLPDFWNNRNIAIINNNNCYSYACNDPFNHKGKPQPGEASKYEPKEMLVDEITKAVLSDGLIKAKLDKKKKPIPKEGYYLVALVVAPFRDYHWFRQDENNLWTHKRGAFDTLETDFSNKKITDPEKCDRNYYTDFGGYFYVPNDGIRIGKKVIKYPNNTMHDDYKEHFNKLDTNYRKEELKKIIAKYGIFKEAIMKKITKEKIKPQNFALISSIKTSKCI